MNPSSNVNMKRIVISAGLLLVFSLVLLIYARELIREVFVIPISYLIWAVGIFTSTTPQIYFWIVLLIFSFMIAYRSLAGKRKVYAPTPPDVMEMLYQRSANQGRVTFWKVKTNLLSMGSAYYHSSFHNSLSRLVIDVLAYRYRLTPVQVEERLEDGTLEVPTEVRDYILKSMHRLSRDSQGYFARLWRSILETVRDWFSSRRGEQSLQAARVDPQVARILEFMKEELEVSHDDSGR